MATTVTPGFAWALPSVPQKGKKPASQPLTNPLLKRAPPKTTKASSSDSKPKGTVQNRALVEAQTNLRRRHNAATSDKKQLPPKLSLTTGGLSRVPTSSVSPSPLWYRKFGNGTYPRTSSAPPNLLPAWYVQVVDENYALSVWEPDQPSSRKLSDSWVVAYGFQNANQKEEVLRRFSSFGSIVTVRGGKSNWIALEYGSPLEAEKALYHRSWVLDGSVIGVVRLDQELRETLDWTIAPIAMPGDLGSRKPTTPQTAAKVGVDDDIYMSSTNEALVEKRSVCERFLGILFGWE